MTVKPLIYGYLRVWTETSDEDAARTERELTEYAEREGFTVAEIFVERPYLPVPAFHGLIQAIGCTETKDIVVPDLSHFCPYHGLGSGMTEILEHVAGAQVWVIQPLHGGHDLEAGIRCTASEGLPQADRSTLWLEFGRQVLAAHHRNGLGAQCICGSLMFYCPVIAAAERRGLSIDDPRGRG